MENKKQRKDFDRLGDNGVEEWTAFVELGKPVGLKEGVIQTDDLEQEPLDRQGGEKGDPRYLETHA